MDKIINITVLNRIATADPGQYIICGNEDYTAVFDFDAEWKGIDVKTARFSRKGIYTDVVFTGNTVVIPEMQNVSRVEIGVFAGDITTTPAVVRCHRSILCGGGNVHEPEPDVYAQIIKMIEEIEPGSGSGGSGEDGGYYVPTVTQVNENTIQISFAASRGGMEKVNAQTITLPSGEDGSPGKNGEDGTSVTVVNVTESTEDGGSNVITFSDGNTLTVKNGNKGADGAAGPRGDQGLPGEKGEKGEKGDTGADGAAGPSGYTPVKGTDYWTDEDRSEIRDELGFSESNVLGLENGGTNATTGDEACENIGAVKKAGDTMTGVLNIALSKYPALNFIDADNGLVMASIVGNVDSGQLKFQNNATDTRYYTAYWLPPTDKGLTSNTSYNFLTTKNVVAISEGGTGGKNVAEAVANLWAEIAKKIEATYNVTKK